MARLSGHRGCYDWCNSDDGCHRVNLHPDFIKTLSKDENCLGIMYDEMEHSIINRNLTLTIHKRGKHLPVFPLALSKDVVIQGELLRLQLKEFTRAFHVITHGETCKNDLPL